MDADSLLSLTHKQRLIEVNKRLNPAYSRLDYLHRQPTLTDTEIDHFWVLEMVTGLLSEVRRASARLEQDPGNRLLAELILSTLALVDDYLVRLDL